MVIAPCDIDINKYKNKNFIYFIINFNSYRRQSNNQLLNFISTIEGNNQKIIIWLLKTLMKKQKNHILNTHSLTLTHTKKKYKKNSN